MNTFQIEKLFAVELAKHKPPFPILESHEVMGPRGEIPTNPCASVETFQSTCECSSSDSELAAWLKQACSDFHDWEKKIGERYAQSPGVQRSAVRLVRRTAPRISRCRNEKLGLLEWTISARTGVRLSTWDADPHSSASIARENAERERAAAQERRAEGAGVY